MGTVPMCTLCFDHWDSPSVGGPTPTVLNLWHSTSQQLMRASAFISRAEAGTRRVAVCMLHNRCRSRKTQSESGH